MSMKYQRRIVRIGNSQGIVLPKTLLKLAEMDEPFYFDVQIEKGKITLRQSVKSPAK